MFFVECVDDVAARSVPCRQAAAEQVEQEAEADCREEGGELHEHAYVDGGGHGRVGEATCEQLCAEQHGEHHAELAAARGAVVEALGTGQETVNLSGIIIALRLELEKGNKSLPKPLAELCKTGKGGNKYGS